MLEIIIPVLHFFAKSCVRYTTDMLDDLKYIHAKDTADALGFAAKQSQQLTTTYDFTISKSYDIENVVFAGMGGSALWALMSLTWPGYSVPFEIWRRYDSPHYVSKKTLLIANSYSGTTEETLSAVDAAEEAGASIIAVARGGKLIDRAKKKAYPHIILPETPQPRLGTLSGFVSLITIMDILGFVKEKGFGQTLHAAQTFLEKEMKPWQPDIPTEKNYAKQLALEIAGTTPVIYGGPEMSPAAYKWKIGFNEAAKNVAWFGEIPEFSHNEFAGWTSHPIDKPYSIIDLRSSYEHPQVAKRFELTERLLSGKRPHPHSVDAKGTSKLEHMLYHALLGDFVSIYVALLNGQDPTQLDIVGKLKAEL